MDCLSNTLLYKKYVCLKVFAPSNRQKGNIVSLTTRQDSSKEECFFPLEEANTIL